ncbi:MAG: ABC transporter permease [Acidimicrobiales bacterium]
MTVNGTGAGDDGVEIVVRAPATRGWARVAERVVQLRGYGPLIVNLARRDLSTRQKRSALGWLWSFINPAASLAILTLVFGTFLRIAPPVAGNGELESFAVYLFCALVVWNLFDGVIKGSITALTDAGPLLNKVYFPPEAPAMANLAVTATQTAFEFVVLVVVLIAVGNISWTIFLWLYLFVLISLLSLGIGLFVSVFNVFYRDVGYLVTLGLQVVFYATPIIYPLGIIPERAWGLPALDIIKFNPIAQLTEMSRDILYDLEVPSALRLGYATCAAVLVFAVGYTVFVRQTENIAEEL